MNNKARLKVSRIMKKCVKVIDPPEMSKPGTRRLDSILFAELVIRECDQYIDQRFNEGWPFMMPGDLLKHFGIEDERND